MNNLEILRKYLAEHPESKFIYMRRTTIDNRVIDIPVKHAEATIKHNPLWQLVGVAETATQVVTPPEIPTPTPQKKGKQWEHKCEACQEGFNTPQGLAVHKRRKHENNASGQV